MWRLYRRDICGIHARYVWGTLEIHDIHALSRIYTRHRHEFGIGSRSGVVLPRVPLSVDMRERDGGVLGYGTPAWSWSVVGDLVDIRVCIRWVCGMDTLLIGNDFATNTHIVVRSPFEIDPEYILVTNPGHHTPG